MKRLAMTLAVSGAVFAAAGAAATVALAQPPVATPADPPAVAAPDQPVTAEPQPADDGPKMLAASGVNLRALDKITGNAKDFSARVGESWTFGRIKGTVRACYQSRPQDTPESAVFLEIRAVASAKAASDKPTNTSRLNKGPQPIGPDGLLFSGWMFASTPGLNALEHPTYDVWVISCNAPSP